MAAQRKTAKKTEQAPREAPRPIDDFEQYALALLREDAASRDRYFLTGSEAGLDYGFGDAVAPSGIGDLPGPCVIEVKRHLTQDSLESFLRRAISAQSPIESVLFVADVSAHEAKRLASLAREIHPVFPVQILDRQRLDELAEKYPDAALPYRREGIKKAISHYLTRDEAKPKEQHLAALRSAYNEDRLALLLGAGVSMSAKFPSWDELIRRLAVRFFNSYAPKRLGRKQEAEIFEYFKSGVPTSPLIVARMLKNFFGDNFADEVRQAVYEHSSGAGNDQSPLIDELATLCLPQRDRLGLTAVVSYNYDSLLEEALDRLHVKYHTLLSDGDEPLRSELPVYHVHGYLPRTGELTRAHKDGLVLSEDSYHAQFIDSYLWSNLVQLNFLRSNVCLLVGFSLTDPNQRRLLEITCAKKPNVRHYAILQDRWSHRGTESESATIQDFVKTFRGLEESSLARLGVSVFWVSSFDEIPGLIAQVRG